MGEICKTIKMQPIPHMQLDLVLQAPQGVTTKHRERTNPPLSLGVAQ